MPNQNSSRPRRCWIANANNWGDVDDVLIGDREGLAALRDAIDSALANGEASLLHTDSEFFAIRMVEQHPAEKE
jgi:hypothetical protein